MIPSIWWNVLNDRGYSVADIRLEMPWVARQPVEDDGAISPGINISEGEMKDFIDMVEKLRDHRALNEE